MLNRAMDAGGSGEQWLKTNEKQQNDKRKTKETAVASLKCCNRYDEMTQSEMNMPPNAQADPVLQLLYRFTINGDASARQAMRY